MLHEPDDEPRIPAFPASPAGSSPHVSHHQLHAIACGITATAAAAHRRRSASSNPTPKPKNGPNPDDDTPISEMPGACPVAPVDAAVVIDEQRLAEEREQREVVDDLHREQQVLPAGAEHEQHRRS